MLKGAKEKFENTIYNLGLFGKNTNQNARPQVAVQNAPAQKPPVINNPTAYAAATMIR